jgi:hypothetical protein
MKTCSKCGECKPLAEFYKHPGGVGGRRGDCKTCVLKARRKRYEDDGDTLRARVRAYQQARRAPLARATPPLPRGEISERSGVLRMS